MSADKKIIQIFIAYAREDEAHLKDLRTHAAPLLRREHIKMWYDGEITAGELWDQEIKAKLAAADIILMLLSPNSLASEYFYNQEVTKAIQRHEAGTAHVVPILLSACLWKKTPLAHIQGLPVGMTPITKWPNRDDAWHDVLMGISELIDKIEEGTKEVLGAVPEPTTEKQKPHIPAIKPTATEANAWEFAIEDDNRAAYEKHLARFPEGFYAAEARERLEVFEADDIFWELALERGTEKAFQKYLDKYPGGLYAAEAQQKINAFVRKREEEAIQNQKAKEAATKKKEQESREQKHDLFMKTMGLVQRILTKSEDPFYDLMIPVKGGTFEMGDTFGEGERREKPVHKVTLSDYWLCKYPVTQGLWEAIMGESNNPSGFKGDDLLPVESVSWQDAQAFVDALNKKTDGRYRLPTEAEWEYAARAAHSAAGEGRGGAKIRFGNGKNIANPAEMNFDARKDYKQLYSVVGEYRAKTTPVNRFPPNALGLYDMAGNVLEWCADWFAEDYYGQCQAQGTVSNPKGPDTGTSRVLRGGSWLFHPVYCRAASRSFNEPVYRYRDIGFRVALSLQ